jgi:hypothetical protein
LTFGDGGLDLLDVSADFVAIVGAQGDVEEPEAIGDKPSDREVSEKSIGRLKSLAGCQKSPGTRKWKCHLNAPDVFHASLRGIYRPAARQLPVANTGIDVSHGRPVPAWDNQRRSAREIIHILNTMPRNTCQEVEQDRREMCMTPRPHAGWKMAL